MKIGSIVFGPTTCGGNAPMPKAATLLNAEIEALRAENERLRAFVERLTRFNPTYSEEMRNLQDAARAALAGAAP